MVDVGSDEPVSQSVLAAVRRSYLDGLMATRDLIARQLDAGVPPRDLASLTKRLSDVVKEIEKISGGEGGVDVNVEDQTFRPEAV